uniref:Superoxide dismutase [Cu-Zn] n=4 Tax=Clastoptera arizonana TaxID=38151 RepID=A0A1B6CAN5_9HEMI
MSAYLCLLIAVSCVVIATAEERRAICIITGSVISGNVTFVQAEDDGEVIVTGIITGLTKGKHGFHVHEKGDISEGVGCKTTGGHFNPDKVNHGGPSDEIRHVGDLGNIFAEDNGIAQISITDKKISLTGRNSIIGRAIVVHSDSDDLGRGGFSDSLTTGHAGTRLGCGVIGIQYPPGAWLGSPSSASLRSSLSIFIISLALLIRAIH